MTKIAIGEAFPLSVYGPQAPKQKNMTQLPKLPQQMRQQPIQVYWDDILKLQDFKDRNFQNGWLLGELTEKIFVNIDGF